MARRCREAPRFERHKIPPLIQAPAIARDDLGFDPRPTIPASAEAATVLARSTNIDFLSPRPIRLYSAV